MSIVNTKGVDISYANGNIDLAKVKSTGYKWVMIRCGYGSDITSQDDTQFASNVAKAEKLGMPWGVYLFSYACSTADAKSELAHIDRLLKAQKAKGYYPTLPIALDIEPSDYVSKKGGWTKANLTNVATIVLDGLANLGYYPMIYTGYTELDNMLSDHIRKDYDCWFAQWNSKPNAYKYNRLGMWQYGGETNYIESNSISGVGTIDKNYAYKDYPTIIKNGGYNGFKKSSTTPTTTPTSQTKTTTKAITESELRQKVANTINAWLGATDGSAGHKEILKIYNAQNPLPVGYKMKDNDAWCAATVSATWLKVGIAQYITTECGCGRFRDNAKKLGIWVENDDYKPKIGDAIIYYWSDNGVGDCTTGADHIGLVTEVSGNMFTVTEGNMGNGIVGKRNMQVNGKYIRGFIAPDYAAIAKKVAGIITPDNNTTTNKTPTTSNVSIPNVTYKVRTNGNWLPEVANLADFAGIAKAQITDVAIKVSKGSVKYRVHVKGGNWLPYVTGYNISDDNNGYAGNHKAIDAIEVYYSTPSDLASKTGYLKAKYRVSSVGGNYYDWQYDNEKTNGQDGYAGVIGKAIDKFQIVLSK